MSAFDSTRTISFQCPHCGHQTDVESRFAGQTGPCASCSKPITIPTLSSLAPQAAEKPRARSNVWIVRGSLAAGAVTGLVLLVIAGMAIVRPVLKAAREAAKCSECESNLLEIGRALDDYYDTHGHYPPAVVRDEKGKPMHSWRVLLLPHLGPEAALVYREYDMDQPWDSTKNRLLQVRMPAVYKCPGDPGLVPEETSYLAVVGDRTVINSVQETKRTGDGPFVLTDRAAETMVVIESRRSGVNWMEPVDIPFAALRAELNSNNAAAPGSEHVHGVNTLMADGSVIRLPDTTAAADLRGMATMNGDDEYIEVLDDILYDQ